MKRVSLVLLAILLAACTATPTAQPVAQEPVVVTVVVEPTQAPQQPEPVVVTVVVEASPVPAQATAVPPTEPPAAATSADTTGAPIVLDDLLGKGVFKNITLSGNEFTLRCVTREMTITATASLVDIEEAELFYRVRDYPQAIYDTPWRSAGKMDEVSAGVFSMVLTGETVNPDSRLDPGWFDFQIIGLNKGGGVVDRTQKIEQLVVYRINCP
ncbi:MAG: hypothetical protein AB1607_18885 [Chloroflexota bacterium]